MGNNKPKKTYVLSIFAQGSSHSKANACYKPSDSSGIVLHSLGHFFKQMVLLWFVVALLCSDAESYRSIETREGGPFSALTVSLLQRQQYGDHKVLPEEQDRKKGEHDVENLQLLNKQGFWWLMGALVLLVAVAVVRVEVAHESVEDVQGAQPEQDANESIPSDLVNAAFCIVGLITCMVIWGVAQEFVMTHKYSDSAGHIGFLPSPMFVVFCNRVFTILFCSLLLYVQGKTPSMECQEWAWPALSNSASSWCQYQSLAYVSFALQTSIKSCKILPVQLISLLRGKPCNAVDFAEGLVITVACISFGMSVEARDGQGPDTTSMGAILLLGFMVFDACTPHLQDRAYEASPGVDVLQATLSMSLCSALVTFTLTLLGGQFLSMVNFMLSNPIVVLHLVVLSLASTITQYMINYTVKSHGPVFFTLVITVRQAISVVVSAKLYNHHFSNLAVVAVIILFGTVASRAVRPFVDSHTEMAERQEVHWNSSRMFGSWSRVGSLLGCIIAIHILYGLYGLTQEFLAYHTVHKEIFAFPVFLVAVNHSAGAVFALVVLRIQKIPILGSGTSLTLLPACSDLIATTCQHTALYGLLFPAQTLMKTLKILPVMIVGSVMRIRSYTIFDYAEAVVISGLVAYFVSEYELGAHPSGAVLSMQLGIFLMLVYIFVDALTSNLEDYAYQSARLDPGQMLLGMDGISGVLAWSVLLLTGEVSGAVSFCMRHPDSIAYVGLLAFCSASGCYACLLTVRLYGPAVLTLVMTSRQILSLLLSVICFQHEIDFHYATCLIVISMLLLASSLRRVTEQVNATEAKSSTFTALGENAQHK